MLQCITPDHLASVLRDFYRAGWLISDIAHALDWKPDGTKWPHSGTTKMRYVAGWIKYRLTPWRNPDGTPKRSRGQQNQARAEHQRAQARAEAEKAKKRAEKIAQERKNNPDPRPFRERYAHVIKAGAEKLAQERAEKIAQERKNNPDPRPSWRERLLRAQQEQARAEHQRACEQA